MQYIGKTKKVDILYYLILLTVNLNIIFVLIKFYYDILLYVSLGNDEKISILCDDQLDVITKNMFFF